MAYKIINKAMIFFQKVWADMYLYDNMSMFGVGQMLAVQMSLFVLIWLGFLTSVFLSGGPPYKQIKK